jgi:hypothetical protein
VRPLGLEQEQEGIEQSQKFGGQRGSNNTKIKNPRTTHSVRFVPTCSKNKVIRPIMHLFNLLFGEEIKKSFFLLGSQEVPFGIAEKKPRQAHQSKRTGNRKKKVSKKIK